MSNPTTPFNWQMPTNTDLVTDLPADFEVFGQAVATSMADLLGGTSGQILSKATNADMDFVWIANDQGDITGVTATSPLTGGGTSGAITVGIQASSTTQSGAVQLTDSTSSTSTTTAATPNSVKTSYDLAAAAVPKSTVTTAGDLIYGTGSSAVTRLGIGTSGQVLRVNSGGTAPEWAAAAGGGKVLQVVQATLTTTATTTSTSYVDTGLTASITPSLATSKVLIMISAPMGKNDGANGFFATLANGAGTNLIVPTSPGSRTVGFMRQEGFTGAQYTVFPFNFTYLDSPASTSSQTYKLQYKVTSGGTAAINRMATDSNSADYLSAISTITLMEIGV
jgi:hypothetical protein